MHFGIERAVDGEIVEMLALLGDVGVEIGRLRSKSGEDCA